MKTSLLLSILTYTTLAAQEPDSSSALFQMRETERNFARTSIMHGRNAAFVEYFADESVIYTVKWLTTGRQYWKDLKDRAVVLKWEPEYMDIADSRDFGISTGPWEAQEYRPYTSPVATGYFLTVWKRQADGLWKVVLDAGSGTPKMAECHHLFTYPKGADKSVSNPGNVNTEFTIAELKEREKQFFEAWNANPVYTTYDSFLAPNARIQCNGYLPTSNRNSIKGIISQLPGTIKWKITASGAASSGDLAFTYGLLDIQGQIRSTGGHYVRIWRKLADGNWYIIIEMIGLD
jgi:ketosteroid isomerase-like protein